MSIDLDLMPPPKKPGRSGQPALGDDPAPRREHNSNDEQKDAPSFKGESVCRRLADTSDELRLALSQSIPQRANVSAQPIGLRAY